MILRWLPLICWPFVAIRDLCWSGLHTRLALYLATRYLRKRMAAWLAIAAVMFSVAVSVVVLGVMHGWLKITEVQVRAFESDLTVEPWGGATVPEDPVIDSDLQQMPNVHYAVPYVTTLALAVPIAQPDGKASAMGERSISRRAATMVIDGVHLRRDLQAGRLNLAMLHARPGLDLSAPALAIDERGTGFMTPRWRALTALQGLDLVGGLAGMPIPLPPRLRPRPGIIVGRELIYSNGGQSSDVGVGRHLNITLPNASGGTRGRVDAEVSDTLSTGIYAVDNLNVLMPIDHAQLLCDYAGRNPASNGIREYSGWRVVLQDDLSSSDIKKSATELRTYFARHSGTAVGVLTWQERRGNLVRSVQIQENLLMYVMLAIQGLCVFIVLAVFTIMVIEKRHDIGVLLGLGVSRSTILFTFIISAGLACFLGGMLGWGLGFGVLRIINPLSEWLGHPLFPQDVIYTAQAPISFDWHWPVFFVSVVTIVGLISAIIPAWRASRVDPIDSLRELG